MLCNAHNFHTFSLNIKNVSALHQSYQTIPILILYSDAAEYDCVCFNSVNRLRREFLRDFPLLEILATNNNRELDKEWKGGLKNGKTREISQNHNITVVQLSHVPKHSNNSDRQCSRT